MTPKGFRSRVEGSESRVKSLDNCVTFLHGTALPERRRRVSTQVTIHERMGGFWGPKGYIGFPKLGVPMLTPKAGSWVGGFSGKSKIPSLGQQDLPQPQLKLRETLLTHQTGSREVLGGGS